MISMDMNDAEVWIMLRFLRYWLDLFLLHSFIHSFIYQITLVADLNQATKTNPPYDSWNKRVYFVQIMTTYHFFERWNKKLNVFYLSNGNEHAMAFTLRFILAPGECSKTMNSPGAQIMTMVRLRIKKQSACWQYFYCMFAILSSYCFMLIGTDISMRPLLLNIAQVCVCINLRKCCSFSCIHISYNSRHSYFLFKDRSKLFPFAINVHTITIPKDNRLQPNDIVGMTHSCT